MLSGLKMSPQPRRSARSRAAQLSRAMSNSSTIACRASAVGQTCPRIGCPNRQASRGRFVVVTASRPLRTVAKPRQLRAEPPAEPAGERTGEKHAGGGGKHEQPRASVTLAPKPNPAASGIWTNWGIKMNEPNIPKPDQEPGQVRRHDGAFAHHPHVDQRVGASALEPDPDRQEHRGGGEQPRSPAPSPIPTSCPR